MMIGHLHTWAYPCSLYLTAVEEATLVFTAGKKNKQ